MLRTHPAIVSTRRSRPLPSGAACALAIGLTCAASGASFAQRPTASDCGTLRAALPAASTLSPTDTLVVARLVFVTFADSPDHALPAWADSLANDLEDFFSAMSNGRHRIAASVVKRTDDSTLMWPALQPASHYAGVGGAGWWTANIEVLGSIAAARPGEWTGVEHVWVFHDQCAFACDDDSSPDRCEDTCPWGGIAGIGVPGGSVPGLTGDGTTQRFLMRLPSARQHLVQAWFAGHEYGHRLSNTQHSPGSDATGDAYVNYGRYDLMRSGVFGAAAREDGLVPYHPLNLARWGWKAAWTIARDTLGVRLPDVFSARGGIAIVKPRATRQTFVLAHHAGRTPYDSKYVGSGLLVWHVRPGDAGGLDRSWDLESAAGRWTGAAPDPIDGSDSLETDALALGSAADFFGGTGAREFSGRTNPASRLYDEAGVSPRELRRSGVAIENLRTDPGTGDRIVDVYVTPRQELLAPLGGEAFAVADTVTVRWQPRPSAEAVDVDVLLSSDDGGTWTPLATGIANDGAFAWAAGTPGDRFRVRIVSRDADGNTGASESAASFAVGADLPPPTFALGDAAPNPSSAGAEVPMELALPARVRAEIVDASGRRVRVLADRVFAAGRWRLAWDGRDDRGQDLPAGVYFARIAAGERRAQTRIVRVK